MKTITLVLAALMAGPALPLFAANELPALPAGQVKLDFPDPQPSEAEKQDVDIEIVQNLSEYKFRDKTLELYGGGKKPITNIYTVSANIDGADFKGQVEYRTPAMYPTFIFKGTGLTLEVSRKDGNQVYQILINGNYDKILYMTRTSPKRYYIFQQGIDLTVDLDLISGEVDLSMYDKKFLSALTCTILRMQDTADKDEKGQALDPSKMSGASKHKENSALKSARSNSFFEEMMNSFVSKKENGFRVDDNYLRIHVICDARPDGRYFAHGKVDTHQLTGTMSGAADEITFDAMDVHVTAKKDGNKYLVTGSYQILGKPETVAPLTLLDKYGDGNFYVYADGISLKMAKDLHLGLVDAKKYHRLFLAGLSSIVGKINAEKAAAQPSK
ncbi:MAG: hypothetical protein A2270_08885 [Elusimicrobia bacterium RIFOXYA12_FULL_51_18]|nr:MAG: hypothetical protein A2270_08885 [Elusimicrobia bacterium RIFOXYA12_FULL_51_18]OGS31508.1 MAG: hypothetical protein A2218_09625 [Elusimicrobia bacterium RIFOXYA2_FULL_53_38]